LEKKRGGCEAPWVTGKEVNMKKRTGQNSQKKKRESQKLSHLGLGTVRITEGDPKGDQKQKKWHV